MSVNKVKVLPFCEHIKPVLFAVYVKPPWSLRWREIKEFKSYYGRLSEMEVKLFGSPEMAFQFAERMKDTTEYASHVEREKKKMEEYITRKRERQQRERDEMCKNLNEGNRKL